ncbi:MAG: hypothetical protein M3X11_26210 [Acidobacteriota bacterium]|nr:hypothetical protein [Acidobacteriota bacterium]
MQIPEWLIPWLIRFLPEKILGFSTALILKNLPDIQRAGKVIGEVVEKLKDAGHTQEQAEKTAAQMIAKTRTMAPDEEAIWASRTPEDSWMNRQDGPR